MFSTIGTQFSTSVNRRRLRASQDKDIFAGSISVQSTEETEVRKGLEAIIEQQKAFEERMTRKLEEAMQNSQAIEKQVQELKGKELEIQVELLKRGNDEMMKRNVELKMELNKIRNYSRHESGKNSLNVMTNPISRDSNGKISADSGNIRNLATNPAGRVEYQSSYQNGQPHSTLNGTQSQKPNDIGLNSPHNTQVGSDTRDTHSSMRSVAAMKKLSLKRDSQNNNDDNPSLNNSNLENDLEMQTLQMNSLGSDFRIGIRGLSIKSQPDQMSHMQSLAELRDALGSPEKKKGTGKHRFNIDLSLIESQKDEDEKPSADNTRKLENSNLQYSEKKKNQSQQGVRANENSGQKNSEKPIALSVEIPMKKQEGGPEKPNEETKGSNKTHNANSQTEKLAHNVSKGGHDDNQETNHTTADIYSKQADKPVLDPKLAERIERKHKMLESREGSMRTLLKYQTFGLMEPTANNQAQSHETSKPQNPPLTRKETPQLEPLNRTDANSTAELGRSSHPNKENGSKILDLNLADSTPKQTYNPPLKEDKDESDVTSDFFDKPGVSPTHLEPVNAFSLLENPDYLSYPKHSVISKQAFLADSNRYLIELRLESKGNEQTLVLILKESPADKEEFEVVAQESIDFKSLRRILKHLDCRDSLPSTVTLKSIKTYGSFVKYIITPFVGVGIDEDGTKRIELWEKPSSLFRRYLEINVFGELCFINFQHISGKEFLLVLTSVASGNSIRIDVVLDQFTFGYYMAEVQPLTTSKDPNAEMFKLIDIVSDPDATAEELKEVAEMISKYETNQEENFEILAVRFKDGPFEEAIIEQLTLTLSEFEGYLKTKGLETFNQINSEQPLKYLKLKLSENKRRCGFFLQENAEKGCVDVYMKNFFETHAPESKKVKAEGHFEYKFDGFWKDYGVLYSSISPDERRVLYSLLSDSFNLEVQEKAMEPDNYEAYEENPIIKLMMDCGVFKRYHLGHKYKFPVTISLMGVRGHPQGVKTTLYSPEECLEVGALLLLQPASWKRKVDPTEKKRQKRFTIPMAMKTEYDLYEILGKNGFDLLNQDLVFKQSVAKTELSGVKSYGSCLRVDLFENHINLPRMARFLRDKIQDLEIIDS